MKSKFNPHMTTRERQYHHILERELDAGKPFKKAQSIAAGVVNKYRARQAAKHRGPKLITKGGSRRQWYPGKKVVKKGVRKPFACLTHEMRFKTKSGLMSHYRSHGKQKKMSIREARRMHRMLEAKGARL